MNDILKFPNPILKAVSVPVKLPISKEDRQLLDEMYSYVKTNNETAVGLSAIQVGEAKRMCAIRYFDGKSHFNYKLVNPKIIRHSPDYKLSFEGCLSVEDTIDKPVKRWRSVIVCGYDVIKNKNIIINADGFLATVLQHELDHMDGILFIDKLEEEK